MTRLRTRNSVNKVAVASDFFACFLALAITLAEWASKALFFGIATTYSTLRLSSTSSRRGR